MLWEYSCCTGLVNRRALSAPTKSLKVGGDIELGNYG